MHERENVCVCGGVSVCVGVCVNELVNQANIICNCRVLNIYIYLYIHTYTYIGDYTEISKWFMSISFYNINC